MTDTLSVEPRRTKASLRSGRDLPVLFHLMDVSRPRGMAKTLTSAVEEIPEDAEPDLAPALDAVDLREPATKPDSLPPVAQSAPLAHEDLTPPPRALAPAESAQDTPAPTPVPT
jgi:hypothetical protein